MDEKGVYKKGEEGKGREDEKKECIYIEVMA